VQYLLAGCVIGGAYAIFALALTFTYNVSRTFNFGQGGMAFVAAFMYYDLTVRHHLPIVAALLLTVLVTGPVLGLALWWLVFRTLASETTSTQLCATIGVQIALVALVQLLLGDQVSAFPIGLFHPPVPVLSVIGLRINADQLTILVVSAIVAILIPVVLYRTRAGLILRGIVDAPGVAALTGLNGNLISALAWAGGSTLISITGIVLAPVIGLQADSFTTLLAASFAGFVIAQMRKMSVAFLAGLGIGIIQSVIVPYLPHSGIIGVGLQPSIPFLVLALCLVWYAVTGRGSALALGERSRGLMDRLPNQRAEVTRQVIQLRRGSWDRPAGWAAAGIIAIGLPFILSNFWIGAAGFSLCIAIIALSWRLPAGEAGIVSLAQLTFAGIGAVTTAQLVTVAGWPFWGALICGAAAAAACGLIAALPILRLNPLYGALSLFGLALLFDNMIFSASRFTPYGTGVPLPRPTLWFLNLASNRQFYFAVLVIFAVLVAALWLLRRSAFGRILAAVRTSPRKAASLGIRQEGARALTVAAGAAVAAVGGGLYACYQFQAFPQSYNASDGLVLVTLVMALGASSAGGAVVCGLSIAVVPEIVTLHLSGRLATGLPILWGLAAINLARNPLGQAQQGRALARRAALWLDGLLTRRPSRQLGALILAEQVAEDASAGPDGALKPEAAPSIADVKIAETRGGDGADPPPCRDYVPLLQAQGISVSFGGVRALSDVDLTLDRQQVLGLIGPNGAGKTTMLGVLSGLQRPQQGRVLLSGRDITRTSAAARARAGIARTFQVPVVIEELTVEDHLRLGAEIARRRPSPDEHRQSPRPEVEGSNERAALLELLGLRPYRRQTPLSLPIGVQRLLEVGQALASRPAVLLLDEPSAGLNEPETDQLSQVLRDVRTEFGVGMILVEHDVDLILQLCDRIEVLDFGEVLAVGSPEEVRGSQQVRAAYFGDATAKM
jgi:ABC-type branched-subunit amino acid transport system ATPase component/branched-subunit amino acid ABC-type transport system permease component